MPYPIPDNLDNIEGWRWYLVPMPDDDQMIQVAWGMWSELANYWMWGLEGPIPEDSDKAAQLWADAIYEAWRVRDMGFPDDILTYIDEVETLLRAIRDSQCCGPQDITDGQLYTDAVTDNSGDVPANIVSAGYASDSNDWTGFAEYKCMIAHVIIDNTRQKLESFAGLFNDEGTELVGGIATVAAVLGAVLGLVTGSWVVLVVGLIASVGSVALAYEQILAIGSATLTAWSAALDEERDAIACAIYGADGSNAALSALYSAVDSNVSAAAGAFVRTMNMGPVVRALYSGRYDQQNVAQNLADAGFSVGGYECCQQTVVASGLLLQTTLLGGTNCGSIGLQAQRDGSSLLTIWLVGNGAASVGYATSQTALNGITADFETLDADFMFSPEVELRPRSTSASSRNCGYSVEVVQAYYNGAWHNVIGIDVIEISGAITITADVSGFTVPVQTIDAGTTGTIKFNPIIAL